MYKITITNCTALTVTQTQLENPFEVLSGIDWAEIHAQHEVEEQIDIRLSTKTGEIIHIKVREMT